MLLAHQRQPEAGVEIAAGIEVGHAARRDLRGTRYQRVAYVLGESNPST